MSKYDKLVQIVTWTRDNYIEQASEGFGTDIIDGQINAFSWVLELVEGLEERGE
jgi:hypothetical protein